METHFFNTPIIQTNKHASFCEEYFCYKKTKAGCILGNKEDAINNTLETNYNPTKFKAHIYIYSRKYISITNS